VISGLRLDCRGVVQGVGLRPALHRLAAELGLGGELCNGLEGLRVELVGPRPQLELWLQRLPTALPAAARLEPCHPVWLPAAVVTALAARPGLWLGAGPPRSLAQALVAPALSADRAPCAACLRELVDPSQRRWGDPFLSCSACGPRYSVASAEPFSRAHTSLAAFPLCPACAREFSDPADRRFHAETIGCPTCGPRLTLLDGAGQAMDFPESLGASAAGRAAVLIQAAATLLAAGQILALQGVGGFQLLVAATNPAAVARLRRRKRRPTKPMALLVADPAWVEAVVGLTPAALAALASPAAPIVLLPRRPGPEAYPGVAPGSADLGVMLPASPLQALLVRACAGPLVATSGNPSGEPLCTTPDEARQRLAGLADGFLIHDRPILRPLDDSLLQLIDGRPALLRRARGYAPEPLPLPAPVPPPGVLALGGDLKCAPALACGDRLWLAPHLGDLEAPQTLERLRAGLAALHAPLPLLVADAHPGYHSHRLALGWPGGAQLVPHHLAHALAVVAEHGLVPPLLALCWDGLGYGPPAEGSASPRVPSLWGGELLAIAAGNGAQGPQLRAQRLAALRPFPLPGGGRALREPRRSALGLLLAGGLVDHPGARHCRAAFAPDDWLLLRQAVAAGCGSPFTTSVGRLFDAVASLLDLVQGLGHEGQGGQVVQAAAARAPRERRAYPLPLRRAPSGLAWAAPGTVSVGSPPPLGWLDWRPLLAALLADIDAGMPVAVCAARVQNGLARGAARALARAARSPEWRRVPAAPDPPPGLAVALAGGCFQNRLLLEGMIAALRGRGLRPYWGEALPANDGGLALGQVWAVALGLTALSDGASPP